MVSFAFWNLNQQPLTSLVSELVSERQVDILMLAENSIDDGTLMRALKQKTGRSFFREFAKSGLLPAKQKVHVFTALDSGRLATIHDSKSGRLTVRTLKTQNSEILLAVLHMPSKVNWSAESQSDEASEYATTIRELELKRNHARTIVVGDFNMNPFERGMVSTKGFHAVMTKETAREIKRTVQRNDYLYFYNPMWSCYGDRSAGPAGTHYYRGTEHVTYFWNLFDQVLIRPELLHPQTFQDELMIVDRIGKTSLCTEYGHPDRSIASDHFPIWFRMDI